MVTTLDLCITGSTARQHVTSNHMQADRKEQFSPTDLKFIVTFQSFCAPDQLLHLCHSLCPTILGQTTVKLGLMLSLLGGSSAPSAAASSDRPTPDKAASYNPLAHLASGVELGGMPTRNNIHVLMIGEPGLGKSQLLHACSAASPRGVYVCSKTSTAAGLTVSVSKDVVTNELAFEAGALVLADGGVCCLDELDNMKGEHKMLLEVMEQQEVRADAGHSLHLNAKGHFWACVQGECYQKISHSCGIDAPSFLLQSMSCWQLRACFVWTCVLLMQTLPFTSLNWPRPATRAACNMVRVWLSDGRIEAPHTSASQTC